MADTVLIDPLHTEVWLLPEVWDHHIVGNHVPWGPLTAVWWRATEDAITAPMVIIESNQSLHPGGLEYYRQAQVGSRVRLIKVCVEDLVVGDQVLRQVKTVMEVRSVGRGAQRWP